MKCLLCRVELSGWKRLVGAQARFCSEHHAEHWRNELAKIGAQRLGIVRSRLREVYGLTPAQLRKAS